MIEHERKEIKAYLGPNDDTCHLGLHSAWFVTTSGGAGVVVAVLAVGGMGVSSDRVVVVGG